MAVTVVFKQQHQKLSPKPTVCSRPIPEFVSVVCTIRAADRPAGRSLNLGRDGEAERREGPVPGKGQGGQGRCGRQEGGQRSGMLQCSAVRGAGGDADPS